MVVPGERAVRAPLLACARYGISIAGLRASNELYLFSVLLKLGQATLVAS